MSHIHPLWLLVDRLISQISSITDREFIELVATYNDVVMKGRTKVSTKVNDRGYTPEQLAHAQKAFEKKFNPITSCKLKFTKPFDHLKYEPFNYVMTLYERYEKGVLPFPGSVSEQPAQIIEVFSVLSQLRLEAEERILEKNNVGNSNKNKSRVSR